MSWKKEAFEDATDKVNEKMEEPKPTPPSSDTGRDENELGHMNITPPQNER